jgi:hypothetical protein
MNLGALAAGLWNNPFTTYMGAATAVLGILHAAGVTLPFNVDPATLATIFASLGLFGAKDANGGSVKQ